MNIPNADYPSRSGNRKFRFWRGGRIGSVLVFALLLLAVSGQSWAQVPGLDNYTVYILDRSVFPNTYNNTMIVDESAADALNNNNVRAYIQFPTQAARVNASFRVDNSGDTATYNTDYSRGGQNAAFSGSGQSSAAGILRVTILEDTLDDEGEFFTITISGGTFLGQTVTPARITIRDNDDASIDLSLSQTDVVEGNGPDLVSEITVTAEHQGSAPASATEVVISVVGDGTNAATAADFTAESLTITIPGGVASSTGVLTLTAIGDRVDEEDATLTVSGTAAGYGGTITPTTLTLEDDDVAGVTITAIGMTVDGGELGELNVNIGATVTEGELNVNIDEGEALEYTIVLNSDPGPGETVEVIFTSRNKNSEGGSVNFSGFGGVFTNVFTSTGVTRWDRPRRVSARTRQDADAVDGTAYLDHTVTGYAGVADADVVNIKLNIIDDETPGLTITPNPLTVLEGGTDPYQYAVRFQHQLVAPATVKPDVGASESAEITVSPAFLNFTQANGNTNQTFTVTVADDTDASDATLIVGHTITGYPEFTDPTRAELTVMVVDDEESPTGVLLEIVPSTAVVAETDADAERTITLRASLSPADSGLLAAPTEVEIMVTGSGTNPATVGTAPAAEGTDIIQTPLTITIPASDRTMTEALTLTVVGDRVAEGTETVTVSGTATSDGTTLPVNSVTLQVRDNDSPTVTLSADPVSESVVGGTVTVTATADLALPGGFSVGVLITPGTATAGEDYTATGVARLTFDGEAGEVETFTVTILPDRVDEGAGETFTVKLISLRDNAVPVVISDTVEVTITDDDVAGVNISRANLALREGNSGTYSIVLNSDPAGSVTVTLAVAPDATADLEIAESLTQVFDTTPGPTHWSTSRTINVTVAQDGDGIGGTPRVMHTISGSGIGYGAVTVDSVVVTVTDDDTAGVALSPSTLAVTEEEAGASYMLRLRTDPLEEVVITVDVGTSTTPPITVSPTSLTFNSGNWETNQSFTVTADADDDAIGGTRTLNHTISGYTGIFNSEVGTVMVTVTDDDTVGVSVSPATLTVTEGVVAGADYTVVLDTIPDGTVTVTVAPDASTMPPVTVSPLSRSFTPGDWNVAQSFTVTADEDVDAVGGTRILGHTVTGYTGLLEANVGSVEVTVIDNDRATFSFVPQRVPVTEGDDEVTLTAVLSSAIPDGFEVTVSTTGFEGSPPPGAPIPGSDYTSTTETLTFEGTANEMVTFTVAILDDDVAENLEVFLIAVAIDGEGRVMLSPANPDDFAADFDFNNDYYVDFSGASAMVTITDDDTAGVTLSETSLAITEEDTAASYTVVLESDPDGPVTVTIDPGSSTTAPITIDPATRTLAFDSTNWNIPQTVTVTATDDGDAVDGMRTLMHTVSGYGTVVSAASVTVTVADNDTPGVTISPTTLPVAEGAAGIYTVVLNTRPDTTVMVTIVPDSNMAAPITIAPGSGILSFDPAEWNTPQTVTVTATEDDDAVDGMRILTHTVSGYGTGESEESVMESVTVAESVTVIVSDNDTAGVTFRPPTVAVTEEGEAGIYTVELDSEPAGAVEITIAADEATAPPITFSPASLTFNPAEWDTPQRVTVTALTDGDTGGGTRTLAHTVSGYVGVDTVELVMVEVTDDDAPTVTIADDIAMGTPVTRTEDIAGTVDVKVTFTFSFSEPVSDFVRGDIMVTGGGTLGMLIETVFGLTYTLDVGIPTTPPTNNGVMTVTVAPGTVSGGGIVNTDGATATQMYDTLAPVDTRITVPADNTMVNAAGRESGVFVSGTNEYGVGVALCVVDTDTACTADTTYTTTTTTAAATTTWSYTLPGADLIANGAVMLTAIATDKAGNTAVSPPRTITIDTTPPDAPAFVDVSGGTITVADRATGVILTGTKIADVTAVTLCIRAVGDTCGTTRPAMIDTTTTWRYPLVEDDYFQGVLTFTATAADAAGNLSMATATTITVDTVAPGIVSFDVLSGSTITATDRDTGVTLTGIRPADASTVTLCIGSVGAACGTTVIADLPTTTTWSYMLEDTDYDSGSGQGKVTFTATATDLAGNPSDPSAIIITVDTIVPVFGNGETPTIIIPVDRASAYNAEATDNGVSETSDVGLTYTLSGRDAGTFSITANTGVVTYGTPPADAVTHIIIITATDAVGNTAMQTVTIMVQAAPTVDITDNIEAGKPATRTEDIAGIADGALTFTFTFSEPVNEFVLADDIIVSGGGTFDTLTGTAPTKIYTLEVTPTTATNGGTLTVTVKANAVLGDTTGVTNPVGDTATQKYDTMAPTTAPTFASFASSTTYINAMHASDGLFISGAIEDGVTTASLCLAGVGGDPCDVGDSGRTTRVDILSDGTWEYMLTPDDIAAMGEDAETLTISSTDAAGNPSPRGSVDVTVDTMLPDSPMFGPVAHDYRINAFEQTNTAISGSVSERNLDVTLNIGGNIREALVDRTGFGRSWTYMLTAADITAMGEGTVMLSAYATDMAGNISETSFSMPILVDTEPPVAPEIDDKVADDNIINFVERNDGITVDGTNAADVVTIFLCIGTGTGTITATNCSPHMPVGIAAVDGITWSRALTSTHITPFGQGTVTLTALALDIAGNLTASLGKDIRVDTILPKFTSSETVTAAVGTLGTAAGVTVYDAIATDNGGGEDEGITYTLGGADALTFEIDPDNGEVRYNAVQNTEATHRIDIIATDTAGNAATQAVAILVRAAPTVDIDDDVTGTANIDSGDVTFTFDFGAESVTGFMETDITVMGGKKGTFTGTDPGTIYTLVVTPTPNTNDGTIRVMVAAGVAFSQNSNIGNVAADSVTQDYDTLAPGVPDFTNVVTDEILNVADQNATLMGTTDADTTITLCFGGTDADCGGDGSMIRTTGVAVGDVTVTGTTWSYTLVPDDITAMDQGTETLRVTATDAAGNSTQGTLDITVDTMAPAAPDFTDVVSGTDTYINVADQDATLMGTTDADTTITLCFGGTDAACGGGSSTFRTTDDADNAVTVTGTTWSYRLVPADITAMGEGLETLRVTATDAAGNTTQGTLDITVDTEVPSVPTFDDVVTDNFINAADQDATLTGPTDADTTITLCFGGTGTTCTAGTVTVSGTTWSYMLMAADITAMGQGAETLRITATDAAGNTAQGTRDITVDTMAPVFTAGDTDTINVAVNTVAAYDATATDHPRITKDEGITYSLSSTDSMTFDIDGATGMVTYTTAPTVAGTYTITITATDTAGNTATQIVTISVVTAPVITITTDVTTATGIANLASGKVTFTFDFREAVTGFVETDITVMGGDKGTFTGTDGGTIYTLVVTPVANTNGGTISVMVAAGVADSQAEPVTGNAAANAEQRYDTLAPDVPTFTDVVTDTDRFINDAERGATLTGATDAGTTITLCFGDTGTTCSTGPVTVTDTTWSYMLMEADIAAMGEGAETLRITAADAAGNTAQETLDITVDTTAPTATPSITRVTETVGGAALKSGDTTTATSLALSGMVDSTLSAGEMVNIYDGDDLLGQAVVEVDRINWSFTDATLAISDTPGYTAVVVDAAGNEGTPTAEFTLTIRAARANADLSGLSLVDQAGDAIALNENFDAATTSYTATSNSVTSVIVMPAVDDSEATAMLRVDGSEVTGAIEVDVGDTVIIVRVTAEDTTTVKDYILTVTRSPANVAATGRPTISGTVRIGETLTADPSAIEDINGLVGTIFAYQWQQGSADGTDGEYADIVSATATTLLLADTQVGRRIQVAVSFTDAEGYVETAISMATDAVAAELTFGTVSITNPDPSYTVGIAIPNLTLPPATGGIGTLNYSLMPIPAGLSFTVNRILAGTPTMATSAAALTYTVTDSAEPPETAALTFMVSVDKGTQKDFGFAITAVSTSVGDDSFTVSATGGSGTGEVTYASDDAAVASVDNNGLVTIVAIGSATATITATKAADDNYIKATDSYDLTVSVGPPLLLFDRTIAEQLYNVGTAVNFTLPGGTGGTGLLTYTLVPDGSIPAGLTFTPADRVLAGTPTMATSAAALTYTVTDSAEPSETAVLTFMVSVDKGDQIGFGFANPAVSKSVGDDPFTVSTTGGSGIGVVTYASGDDTVASVVEDSGVVTIVAIGSTTITATKAADDNYKEATDSYDLVVAPTLTFVATTMPGLTYNINEAIANLTLPEASGGTPTLNYALTPLPVGLAFDSANRVLSGTPTEFMTRTLTYSVTDSAISPVSTALTFTVRIEHVITVPVPPDNTAAADLPIDLDGDAATDDPEDGILTLPAGHPVKMVILSEPAETATSNPPTGIAFIPTTATDIELDTPLAENTTATVCLPTPTTGIPDGSEAVLYHYEDESSAWRDISSESTTTRDGFVCGETNTFSPFVVGYLMPDTNIAELTFGTTTISPQIYNIDEAITDLILPAASGGTPTLNYALTALPVGLSFAPVARILSGIPTMASEAVSLTYTVTDSASSPFMASLTFTVTVLGRTLTMEDVTVDEGNGTATVTVRLNIMVPAGFTVEASTEDDTATAGQDYTAVMNQTLTFAGNAAETQTFTVDIIDDEVAEIDELLTVSLENLQSLSGDDIEVNIEDMATVTITDNDNDNALTTRLNEQILTRASQAMTASTLEAVARRVDAAADGTASSAGGTGTTPALAYQFGGQSSLNGLLKSHGKAILEDNMEYERLFDGASFVVPLSAAEGGIGGGKSGGGTLSIWGGSDLRNLDSDYDGLDWDGEVVSIHFGVDKLVGEKALVGLALSLDQSSFNYKDTDDTDSRGEYNYNSTNLHPYFGWFPNKDLKLWASTGFGSGEIEIKAEEEAEARSTNTAQLSLAGGFSRQLLNSTKQTSGNTTTLNLKGDVSMTSVDVEAKEGSFDAQKVSSSRLRVLLSGAQRRGLASGGSLTPSLEMGVRNDGGDGVTGTGVELGGGLRYANSGGNVAVAGNVRTLLAHGYTESGADFLLQRLPSAGRGLSLSLHPVWGKAQSAADKLWNDGASEIAGEADSDTSPQSSLDAEVGYGVTASILGTPGVLTPYTGMTATDGDTSRLRLGSRFADGNGLSLNLEGARENTADGASHIVLLRGEVSF